MPITILIVEDDGLMRSALAGALERHGLAVQTALSSARDALALPDLPDVCLLDLDLGPGPTGIDLALALRDRSPSIGIVLLTSYDDPRLLRLDLPPAPRGTRYLRKREVDDIAMVVRVISATAAHPLDVTVTDRAPLSATQIDVLRGIAGGLSNAEIAQQRGVTEKAVEKTISRLCGHFGIERETARNQRVRLTSEFYSMTGQVP